MTAKGPNHPNRPSSSTIVRGRLGRIVRGYLGACFIAAWGLPLGLIMGDVAAGHRIAGRLTDFGVVVGGFFVILLVAAAPFATAVIVVTETTRIRAAWVFMAAGAGIGVIIEAIALTLSRSPATVASPVVIGLIGITGALAGAAYWALAVRGTRPPVTETNDGG